MFGQSGMKWDLLKAGLFCSHFTSRSSPTSQNHFQDCERSRKSGPRPRHLRLQHSTVVFSAFEYTPPAPVQDPSRTCLDSCSGTGHQKTGKQSRPYRSVAFKAVTPGQHFAHTYHSLRRNHSLEPQWEKQDEQACEQVLM